MWAIGQVDGRICCYKALKGLGVDPRREVCVEERTFN